MLRKSFEVLEAKADAETGTFEATVAVFNNVDHGGDRILPGAFTKSLEQWRESGDPIPVIFNHDWADANAHIGIANASDVVETDKGLFVKAQLDVEDNPVAKQVHRLLERRSLKEFSFGYHVPKGGEKRAKDGANDLSEIAIVEVGPTLKGMNPSTELHGVKSALGVEEDRSPEEVQKDLDDMRLEMATKDLPEEQPVPAPDPFEAIEALSGKVDYLLALVGAKELPEGVKESLSDQERQILDAREKKSDVTDRQPEPAGSVDPLRKRAMEVELELRSGGLSTQKPPTVEEPPAKEPELELGELRERSRDEMLALLSGIERDQ